MAMKKVWRIAPCESRHTHRCLVERTKPGALGHRRKNNFTDSELKRPLSLTDRVAADLSLFQINFYVSCRNLSCATWTIEPPGLLLRFLSWRTIAISRSLIAA